MSDKELNQAIHTTPVKEGHDDFHAQLLQLQAAQQEAQSQLKTLQGENATLHENLKKSQETIQQYAAQSQRTNIELFCQKLKTEHGASPVFLQLISPFLHLLDTTPVQPFEKDTAMPLTEAIQTVAIQLLEHADQLKVPMGNVAPVETIQDPGKTKYQQQCDAIAEFQKSGDDYNTAHDKAVRAYPNLFTII